MRTFTISFLLVLLLSGICVPTVNSAENGGNAKQLSEAQITISTDTEKESLFYQDFIQVFEGYLFTLWSEGAQTMASPGMWEVNVASDYLYNMGLPFVVISVYHKKFETDLYLVPLFETGNNQVASAAVNAALRTVSAIVQQEPKRKKEESTF